MPPIDSSAKALYRSFNAAQLREVALAAKVSNEKLSSAKTKDSVLEVLEFATDPRQQALLAHRVETLSPFKHCVLLQGEGKLVYEELKQACGKAFARIISAFTPLDSTVRDVTPQLCIFDDAAQRIFVKFAHQVDVYKFEKKPEGVLKVPAVERHIMVAVINASLQLVYITFPGFTQAVPGERSTYDYFARQVVSALGDEISLQLEPFQLKPATDFLLDDKGEQVVDLRRTVRFRQGGRMALDSESDSDAASALAHGLKTSGVSISADAIRAAFRQSEAQAIVLLWQKQGVITRISLRNTLPEILFIWNECEPSLSLIDDVLERIAKTRAYIGDRSPKEAIRYIESSQSGEVIRPGWLEQHFAIGPGLALKLLLDACATHVLAPVFRMRPDKALSAKNPWVRSLGELQSHGTTEEGEILESGNPENVEIAFLKIGSYQREQVAG